MPRPRLIILSDLDGTLLDHHGYGFEPARPVLARLERLNIPVVLSSSKTAAEMAQIAALMPGVARWPFVCENGAGIVWPDDAAQTDREDWHRLRAFMQCLPSDLRGCLTGFGDLGPDGIAAATGLSRASAVLAGERQFSEPCLWTGDDAGLKRLARECAAHGIKAQQGGRFLTLGFGHTKASRVDDVRRALAAEMIVALGDAPNDRDMIAAADMGVVVPNPAGPAPNGFGPDANIIHAPAPGPAGWAGAVTTILDDIGFDEKGKTAHG